MKDAFLFFKGREKSQHPGILLEDIAGMRPESDYHTFLPHLFRIVYQLRDDQPMAQMDSVEEACRYNHFTSSMSCL